MKKTILSTLGAAALLCLCQGQAQAQMLTISEVYGGGGNSGSTLKNDFIELYNYGTTPIDLSATALSLYYASATGTFTTTATASTSLGSGIIPAGAYFLVQEAAGGAGTTNNPTPNVTGSINLSATTGKVALALSGTAPSSTAGAVTLGNGLIDFVGFGTANQFLTAVGPAPSVTNSISRGTVTTTPTNNSTDYTAGAPSPQTTTPVLVPEPSIYAMMGLGIFGMFALLRLRRRTA